MAGIPLSVSSIEQLGDRFLVIFDGHCGLCNRSVRWFLCRDTRDRMRFAPSDSPKVAELLTRHGFVDPDPSATPNSILVVRDPGGHSEQILSRSDAVVALLAELPRPWPAWGGALRWIPRPLRDLGYRIIARWRYHIWGRLDSCPIPTAAERERFL